MSLPGGLAMTTKRDIGLAIQNLRKKAGLKQKDLVKKINPRPIAVDTLSRIERGNYNYTIDLLFRIAEALECDVSDFFCPKIRGKVVILILFWTF